MTRKSAFSPGYAFHSGRWRLAQQARPMVAEIETQDAAHVDVLVPDRREPSRHLIGMIIGRGVDHRLDAVGFPGHDEKAGGGQSSRRTKKPRFWRCSLRGAPVPKSPASSGSIAPPSAASPPRQEPCRPKQKRPLILSRHRPRRRLWDRKADSLAISIGCDCL